MTESNERAQDGRADFDFLVADGMIIIGDCGSG